MENLKTHIISVLIAGVFLLFAISSQKEDSNSNVPGEFLCEFGDPLETNTISPIVEKAINCQILVLDKETGQPIPEITVDVFYDFHHCAPLLYCPDKCLYEESGGDGTIGLTEANGIFLDNTTKWTPKDKNDYIYVIFRIKDEGSSGYAYKRLDKTIRATDNGLSVTTYLLKDKLL
jgi:hypothetical protein